MTDAFALQLSPDPVTRIATDYVGRVTIAMEFEMIPMYRLRPAPLSRAQWASRRSAT